MYAITGITGKVGGALADALLEAGLPVRAVVRDVAKGEGWRGRGCEIAIAEMEDEEALTRAFTGAEAAFILPPSEFDPEPGYPEDRRGARRAGIRAPKPRSLPLDHWGRR
jgi:NAD(P)H dehydrogenase (quinone)